MEKLNYFDVLKLSSDAKDKDIQEALEKYHNNIKARQGGQNISAEEMKKALALLETMKAWAQDKEAIKKHRDEFIEKQSNAILAYFKNLPNNYEAYKREIDSWVKKYRLTLKEIEKLMVADPEHKIIKVKGITLPPNFLISNFSNYQKSLEDFGNNPQLVKIWPWANQVKDFYDFLGYASNQSKETIKHLDTPEIAALVAEYKEPMIAKAGGGSGATSLPLRTAFGQMQTVFDVKKPELRKQYDNTLRYETLRHVFDVIKDTPEEMRKDDKFVGNILKQIKKVFDEDELALAIYNKEAGLTNDPYEPTKVVISMRCSSCGTITQFATRDMAKKGICQACGLAYYKNCPSCNQLIPTSSQICPECNLNIFELYKAVKYFEKAKAALLKNDYNEAFAYMTQAENADPKMIELKKCSDFQSVKSKINALYEDFKKYLTNLTTYISSKQFVHAQEEAETVKAKNPNIDLSAQLKVINEALNKAKSLMPSMNELNENTVLRCYEILDIVSDYLPANELIRKVKLHPVTNLNVNLIKSDKFGVNISYSPSQSVRVTYYIVRNDSHEPKTHSDGEIILQDSDKLVFEDYKITSGKKYYYSIFCCREGVFSAPTSITFSAYVEIEKVESRVSGQKCSLTFNLPINAVGARIYRKDNSIPQSENDLGITLISDDCHGVIDDNNVLFNHQYGYLIQTCYLENNQKVYTKGIGILVKVEKDPSDLNDVKIIKQNGIFKVSFTPVDNSSINSVRLFTCNPQIVSQKLHKLYSIDEINALLKDQKLLCSSTCQEKNFSFSLTGNFSHDVCLVSSTDVKGIITFIGKISSIETLEIDLNKSEIKEGSKAYIRLKNIPSMLYAIHYLVVDVNNAKNEITQEDINRHISFYTSVDTYKKDGLIVVTNRVISSGTFKVLMVGEFVINNKHVFSETTTANISLKKNIEIKYKIDWKKMGLFKKKFTAKLLIETKDQVPGLILMGRDEGAPLSVSDVNATKILEIKGKEDLNKISSNTYEIEIPESECYPGRVYRLFAEQLMVKIVSSDYNSLKFPK